MNKNKVRICLTSEAYTDVNEYIEAITSAFLAVSNEEESVFTYYDPESELRELHEKHCPNEQFEVFKQLQIAVYTQASKGKDYRMNGLEYYLRGHKSLEKKAWEPSGGMTKSIQLDLMIIHCGTDLELGKILKEQYGFHLYHIKTDLILGRKLKFIEMNPGYTDEQEKVFETKCVLPLDTYDEIFEAESRSDVNFIASLIYVNLMKVYRQRVAAMKKEALENRKDGINLLGL